MVVRIARIYDHPKGEAGEIPVLVDRLWPRGIAKDSVPGLRWMKEWAPSAALREWFHAHPGEFESFRKRYLTELDEGASRIGADLALISQEGESAARSPRLLLLYGSRDPDHNNAIVLRDYLNSIGHFRPIPKK